LSKYSSIFFDLDHTLWDFETNSRNTLLEAYDIFKLKEIGIADFGLFFKLYQQINDELWDEYRKGWISKEKLRDERFNRVLNKHFVNDEKLANKIGEFYIMQCPQKSNLFPHTMETLAYLDAKYSLYIITNGFEEVQEIKLKVSGLKPFFKRVITSEKAGYKKPHPTIFNYALGRANAKNAESIMIGDNIETDIKGAKAAGIDSVLFNPHKNRHNTKATYEISCLSELKQLL
jgi:putative hydrolase of the HAD superfamily